MSGTDSSRRMCASMAPHIRRTATLALAPTFDRDRDFRVFAGIVAPRRLTSWPLQPIIWLDADRRTRRAVGYGVNARLRASQAHITATSLRRAQGWRYILQPDVRNGGCRCEQ